MSPGQLDATLRRRVDVAPDTAFFEVELDAPLPTDEGQPAFRPGQYVTVGLPTPEGLVKRPLTLASTPARADVVELLVNRVETPASAHPLSHALFDLPVGGRLAVRPVATGRFTLEDTVGEAAGLLMVASHTGVAPFLSMVRDRRARGLDCPDWVLVQVVGPHGPIAADELAAAPGLTHVVLGTDELALFDDPDALEARLGVSITPAERRVLACGLAADIAEVVQGLLRRGYVPGHRRLRKALGVGADYPADIHLELYDGAKLVDTKDPEVLAALQARFHPPQSG